MVALRRADIQGGTLLQDQQQAQQQQQHWRHMGQPQGLFAGV